MEEHDVGPFVSALRSAFADLARLPMPVIAAIDGPAIGGGLELALATDFRIAGSGCRLAVPETGLGVISGASGTQRLPRLVGMSRAKDLVFSGRTVEGEEALRMGLVDRLVPSGEVFGHAVDLAKMWAQRAPVAMRMAKRAMLAGTDAVLQSGLGIEELCYAQVIPTADRLEGAMPLHILLGIRPSWKRGSLFTLEMSLVHAVLCCQSQGRSLEEHQEYHEYQKAQN